MVPIYWQRPHVMGAFVCLAVIFLTAWMFWPALSYPTVFDDDLFTSGKIRVDYAHLLPLKPRTLSYLSFLWIEQLGGDIWWQRLFTLCLHLVNGCLIFVLGRNAFGSKKLWLWALVVGLFLISPTAVYAVSYLIQRSIVMATTFGLLGLIGLQMALSKRSVAWLVFCTASILAAAFSKEHAVLLLLPAMVWVVIQLKEERSSPHPRDPHADALPTIFSETFCETLSDSRSMDSEALRYGRRFPISAINNLGPVKLSAAALCATAVAAGCWQLLIAQASSLGKAFDVSSHAYIARIQSLPGLESLTQGDFWALSVIQQGSLFWEYLGLWILPVVKWMSIDMRPGFPMGYSDPSPWVGALSYVIALCALIVACFKSRHRLVCWFLLTPMLLFGTELSTVWIQDPFVLYRSYLWFAFLPPVVYALTSKAKSSALPLIGIGLALCLWFRSAGVTDRVQTLESAERAWGDAVRLYELSAEPNRDGAWRPYSNLAVMKMAAGKLDDARALLNHPNIQSDPLGAVSANLGILSLHARDFAAAKRLLEGAVNQHKLHTFNTDLSLLKSYNGLQHCGDAKAVLNRLETLYGSEISALSKDGSFDALISFGDHYYVCDEYQAALTIYLKTDQLQPGNRQLSERVIATLHKLNLSGEARKISELLLAQEK